MIDPEEVMSIATAVDALRRHLDHVLQGFSKELKEIKSEIHRHQPDAKNSRLSALITTPSAAVNASPAVKTKSPLADPAASRPRSNSFQNVTEHQRQLRELRRQLSIMQQVFTESRNDVTEQILGFRQQTDLIRSILQTASNKVDPDAKRKLLEAGKAKLQQDAADLKQDFEKLVEEVDRLKADIVQRGSYPAAEVIQDVQERSELLQRRMVDLQSYVGEVKPLWKQTWERELQNVVKEQQFLKGVEESLDNYDEDYTEITAIFDQVQQFIEVRNSNKLVRKFEPKQKDKRHSGLRTVMQEIVTVDVDSKRRIAAMEKTEQIRKSDLSRQNTNAFQQELGTFVSTNKLKRTGGVSEVERQRRQREQEVLEALFEQIE